MRIESNEWKTQSAGGLLNWGHRGLRHVVFWGLYVAFFTALYGSIDGAYGYALTEMLLSLPAKMAFTYTALYLWMPLYLERKRYAWAIAGTIITALIAGLLQRFVFFYGVQAVYNFCFNNALYALTPPRILNSLISMYIVAAFAVMVKLLTYVYQQERRQEALERQQLEAELNFLKSQVHPHFLFNTLNNLYSLTLNESKRAPEVVLRLSELLDYMLYEANADRIAIHKEVELIAHYLELERLRYGDRLSANFHHSIDDPEQQIAPMLVLPFVENAFKHGISHKTSENWLVIDWTVKKGEMRLTIENSKPDGTQERIIERPHHKGIGLHNVQRRLALQYEGRYDLQTFDNEDAFLVVLKLTL